MEKKNINTYVLLSMLYFKLHIFFKNKKKTEGKGREKGRREGKGEKGREGKKKCHIIYAIS